jgi:hypothetical protein
MKLWPRNPPVPITVVASWRRNLDWPFFESQADYVEPAVPIDVQYLANELPPLAPVVAFTRRASNFAAWFAQEHS